MLAIIFSWCLMMGVIYLGSVLIFKNSYKHLENEQAQINLNKISNALDSLINITNSFLLGSALWDEIYDYAVDYNDETKTELNAKFLESFQPQQFQVNSPNYIDLVMLYTKEGTLNPNYSAAFNTNRTAFIPVPNDILNLFKQDGVLRHLFVPAGKNSDAKGLLLTNHGLLILTSHSVRKTSGDGDSHGTLIFGRYLTKPVWNDMLNRIKLNANLYTLNNIHESNKLLNDYTNLMVHDKKIVSLNQQTLLLYSLLKDINKNNIGMIKIIMPRELYLLGNTAIKYFNIAFFIGGLLFSIVLFYLIKLLVIQRLGIINDEILYVVKTEDFSNRIRLDGKDELTFISTEINKMLMTIEDIKIMLMDIINAMPSLIILVDDHFCITTMNSFAEKMIGKNQPLQKPIFKVFPYLQAYERQFHSALFEKKVEIIHKISRISPNKIEYFNVAIYPLVRHGQNILAIRIDDITDRIQKENQIEKSKKLSSIGILMHDVVAEIDQPTQVILSKIDILKNHIKTSLDVLKKYSEIRENSDMINIEKLEKNADIANDFKETKKIIDEIQQNANKIAEIVKSLKVNSRMESITS